MKKIVFLVVVLSFSLWLKAQQSYADSLQNLLKQTTDVQDIVAIQFKLSDWYRSNEQYTDAINKAEESLNSGLKISKSNVHITKSYWMLSNIYANMEEYEKSRQYVDKAYQSAAAQPDSLALAYAHYAEAVLQNTVYDKDNATKNLHTALSKINDYEKESLIVARIYYLLYTVYSEWDDEQESIAYAQKAITYAQKSGNKNQLVNAYSALAVAYKFKHIRTKLQSDIDSSLHYLDNGIELFKTYPGQVANNTYGTLCINKASYLLSFYNIKDPVIKEALLKNVNEALLISTKVSNNQRFIASGYGILSELSQMNNDLKSTEKYLLQAYALMLQKKTPYYYTLKNVVGGLSQVYAQIGDYKKALEFQQKVTEYSTLLFDENKAATTKRLEAQYEFTKKEQEMQTLKDKADSQKKQKYLLIGLIGIGIVGAFFMFRSYHFNLRYSLLREKQLKAEHQEAEMQVRLQKEEQARLKAEQELSILQQQKLQNEVMASQLHVQHKNELLQQLKEKLTSDAPVNMQQVLREESMNDSNFEKARFDIQEVHPDFFRNLNEKSRQKLTSLDLKYCAYLYLGMDTKQIAQLLNVEPKSVRMTKYRLKQKFELDADTDLILYLKNVG